MSKYSFEFKKKVVLAYLNGEGGYGYLSKTYGIPAKRNIEQWGHNYQIFGDEGLLRSRKNNIYILSKKAFCCRIVFIKEPVKKSL